MAGYHTDSPSPSDGTEKPDYHAQQRTLSPIDGTDIRAAQFEDGSRLHRGLKARHITMIAIGGAIGQSNVNILSVGIVSDVSPFQALD